MTLNYLDFGNDCVNYLFEFELKIEKGINWGFAIN